mmetsp:Transcript_129769/g.352180  ORF Transcript_129769/g.352180 Transcript_129769/m.352180 type:complete len:219 (+) Transcript_129769:153-809(+)
MAAFWRSDRKATSSPQYAGAGLPSEKRTISRNSAGEMSMGQSKCAETTRSNGQEDSLEKYSSAASGCCRKMRSRMMGATSGLPPFRRRRKLSSQPGCHLHGRALRVSGTTTSPSWIAPGLKNVAKTAILSQPLRRASAESGRSPPSSRAWYASAFLYSGSSSSGGGSCGIDTRESVTTSVFDLLWKRATSAKVPMSSCAVSQSSAHGRPSGREASSVV